MKRLLLSLAAAAAALGPLATAPALAESRWERREERYERREERWERRGGRDGYDRRDGRGEGYERREWNNNGRRGYEERRWRDAPPPAAYRREGPAPQAWRRGGRLPPGYAPQVIEDYPRYRLRPPPRGYTWRHVDEGYLLTGPNGVIFDIIPE